MAESTVKYPYAIDENDRLVFINDVARETRSEHQFRCPHCGEKMTPRQGNHNEWHFAHGENHKCGVESYVHKMAKLIIANRFNCSSKPFCIRLKVEPICRKAETCQDYDESFCQIPNHFEEREFDLKQYYTLPAQIECEIKDHDKCFRPDVLLRSLDPKREDIYIEIFYRHKSSEQKVSSGYKILELRLWEMDDLKKLDERLVFSYNDHDVSFWGFNRIRFSPGHIGDIIRKGLRDNYLPDQDNFQDDFLPKCLWSAATRRREYHLRRFTLYKSGKSWIDGIYEHEMGNHHPSAILDITYDYDKLSAPLNLNVIAAKKYRPYRTCHFCHHCKTWGDTGTTWCKIRKNGSTQKRTFDERKGVYCQYFEWYRSEVPFDEKPDNEPIEGIDYEVWVNPSLIDFNNM